MPTLTTLYNHQVLTALGKLAQKRSTSIGGIFLSTPIQLEKLADLSNLSARSIRQSSFEVAKAILEKEKSPADYKKELIAELTISIKETFEENAEEIRNIFSISDYELLVSYLLEHNEEVFLDFCNSIHNVRSLKERVNEANDDDPSLSSLTGELKVVTFENQNALRRLLEAIDPSLNKEPEKEPRIWTEDIEGNKVLVDAEFITFDPETGEIKPKEIQSLTPTNLPDKLLGIVRDLHELLPEKEILEDTITVEREKPSQEKIDALYKLAVLKAKERDLFSAQLLTQEVIRTQGITQNKRASGLLRWIKQTRRLIELPGKEVTVKYTSPIPVANKNLWIAKGDDLNKINIAKKFDGDSFYLVGENLNHEVLKITDSKPFLLFGAIKEFNDNFIPNRGMMVTCSGNEVTVDQRSMSFASASNDRLIAAHKVLTGSHIKKENATPKGLIEESIESHFLNTISERRIDALLERSSRGNIFGDELKKFIYDVVGGENPIFTDLDMHGAAGKEIEDWKQCGFVSELNKYIIEICYRGRDGESTTQPPRKILKRDDFLELLKIADFDDMGTGIVLQAIITWNLESCKHQDDYHSVIISANPLRSNTEGITGPEDEINIRLQRQLEAELRTTGVTYKIDSFSEENHGITNKTRNWRTEQITLYPELAYSIIKGNGFNQTAADQRRKYDEIVQTIRCYL